MLAEGKKECRPIDGAAAEIKSVLGRTTMKHWEIGGPVMGLHLLEPGLRTAPVM